VKRRTIFLILIVIFIALGTALLAVANIDDKQNTQDVKVINEAASNNGAVGSSAAYRAYSPEAVASASAQDKIVLFFHASWCPTCHVLDKDITDNSDKIPANVRILKADFDNETELKKKYGVRLQHTLVQVDKNGQKIALWSQSPSLSDVLNELQ